MYERIAHALLVPLFFRVSAVVSLDAKGSILYVDMLNTDWPRDEMCVETGTREIWLISNHPEGTKEPYPQDMDNLRRIASAAKGRSVRLFLCSEYFSCFEAERLQM